MTEKPTLHQQITDKIVRAIEAGAGDFQMPWHRAASNGHPINATTKKRYRGINSLSLWVDALDKGYPTGEWATFKQWQSIGAQVRKGERASLILFYKKLDRSNRPEDAETDENGRRQIFVAKASYGFNAAQVDGYEAATPAPSPETVFDKHAHAESVIAATGATIRFGGSRAFYSRLDDAITVPEARDFIGTTTSSPRDAYYSTIFHELAHWTGAETRLNREKGKRFGDKPYAFEELIAELSAAMSCADFSIASDPRPDHAQYIASWLKVLKDDNRTIFTAAAAASAATDYIAAFSQKARRTLDA